MPKFLKSGKQAQFEVPAEPLTVIMEDEITHTADFPVCANSENCICYELEQERALAEAKRERRTPHRTLSTSTPPSGLNAPLNGDRSFRLLR